MPPGDERGDPRIYMAAERTFLAWLRTAIALMAFGFVISRFGLFLRMLAASTEAHEQGSGTSVAVGMTLIGVGVVVAVVAAVRHRAYVRGIDEGRFRSVFGSTFAFAIAALLALVGLGMAVLLARL